jgi:hypothetical protein
MPRDELVKAVPPEKFLQLLRAFLNCDPYGDELREQVYEQSKLVDEIENPHIEMDQNGKPKSEVVQKVRQIREKRETKFQEIRDKKGKKGFISEESNKKQSENK